MKVIINAISISEGGSIAVLENLLCYMSDLRPDITWVVILHRDAKLKISVQKRIVVFSPCVKFGQIGVLIWYEVFLRKLVKEHQPQAVFSLTNYLPWLRLPCKTVLLVQHAGHFSPEFKKLLHQDTPQFKDRFAWAFKSYWVKNSVQTADHLTVQTLCLAKEISQQTKRPLKTINVIPHGPGVASKGFCDLEKNTRASENSFIIGYISKWGVQKNFLTLFLAVKLLLDKGKDVKLVLTLNTEIPQNKMLLQQCERIGVGDAVINYQEVSRQNIHSVYRSLDVFAFPSLVESFGLPMVEAMSFGLPIVAARTPCNLEVIADGGYFFDPLNPKDLASILESLIERRELYEEASRLSMNRGQHYSWTVASQETLALIESD